MVYYCQNLKGHNPPAPVKVPFGQICPECKQVIDWERVSLDPGYEDMVAGSTRAVYPKDKFIKEM